MTSGRLGLVLMYYWEQTLPSTVTITVHIMDGDEMVLDLSADPDSQVFLDTTAFLQMAGLAPGTPIRHGKLVYAIEGPPAHVAF